MPEGTLHLPVFYDTLRTLDQTVTVDYYLPGCPPEADNIWEAIAAIVEGKLPPKGSVIGVEHDRLRRVQAEAEREEDQEVLPHLADHSRRGDLPAGAGPAVLRHRHAGRLRGPVPAGQLALHRLPRAQRGRGRLRRAADERRGLGDRLQRPGGDRPHHPEGIPDPVGTFYRFSLAGSLLRRTKNGRHCNGQNCKLKSRAAIRSEYGLQLCNLKLE